MLTWTLVGLALWIAGFGFVMALMRVASDEDRGARRIERSIDPFSDVTYTGPPPERTGDGPAAPFETIGGRLADPRNARENRPLPFRSEFKKTREGNRPERRGAEVALQVIAP